MISAFAYFAAFFIKSILKHYRFTFIRASEKEALKQQLNTIVEQYKIKDEKDHELMILRHDMKHILIATSSLIKEKRYDDVYNIDHNARMFIDEKLKELDINSFKLSLFILNKIFIKNIL